MKSVRMAITALQPFWGSRKGRCIPKPVLNRILFATRYTRHLNRFGYLRVQGWKLYGERSATWRPGDRVGL